MEAIKFIVGITGGSGVGKTTLINHLYEEFDGKISTLSLDNYYKPKSEQEKDHKGVINFDLPSALDIHQLETDLSTLMSNKPIAQQKYNFNNPEIETDVLTIEPKDILIVEGLFVMHYPFVRQRLDYSVYLSVNPELQLERRLKRDTLERNYSEESVLYQWHNHVMPAYENYVRPYKPKSDLIITNNTHFDENIHTLMSVIHQNIDQ